MHQEAYTPVSYTHLIMEKNGVKKEIGTSWPIIKACIASQGTVAVLVSENENYYVKLLSLIHI